MFQRGWNHQDDFKSIQKPYPIGTSSITIYPHYIMRECDICCNKITIIIHCNKVSWRPSWWGSQYPRWLPGAENSALLKRMDGDCPLAPWSVSAKMEVSWNGSIPSHHPFIDGFFMKYTFINHPARGYPHLWKPPNRYCKPGIVNSHFFHSPKYKGLWEWCWCQSRISNLPSTSGGEVTEHSTRKLASINTLLVTNRRFIAIPSTNIKYTLCFDWNKSHFCCQRIVNSNLGGWDYIHSMSTFNYIWWIGNL